MIRKGFGTLLLLFGGFSFLCGLLIMDFFLMAVSGFLIFLGLKFVKKPKVEPATFKSRKDVQEKNDVFPKDSVQSYTFRAAGVTKENDREENIQKILQEVAEEDREFEELYEGLSNTDILEDYGAGEKVYELPLTDRYDIGLVPEPDNPYDSEAIKVVHKHFGHIGYVPRIDTSEVKHIVDNYDYGISWSLVGGRYKTVDSKGEKVKTGNDTYGVEVELIYSETDGKREAINH